MGGPSSVILVVQMPGISCGGRFDCGVFSFKIVLFEWMVFEVGLYPLLSMPSMMVNCQVMFWVPYLSQYEIGDANFQRCFGENAATI